MTRAKNKEDLAPKNRRKISEKITKIEQLNAVTDSQKAMRSSTALRAVISEFTHTEFETFIEEWRKIKESAVKCKIYVDMLKYVVPSLNSVAIEDKRDEPDKIKQHLLHLAELSEEIKNNKKVK